MAPCFFDSSCALRFMAILLDPWFRHPRLNRQDASYLDGQIANIVISYDIKTVGVYENLKNPR